MGFALPNGAVVFAGSKMAAALPTSAVSNAKGAVFTVVGSTLAAGDIVLIKSGWGLIDNLVAKVTTATTTAVTIGSLDTSDVNFFPTGAGAGSLTKVTEWTQIPQITEVAASGGDQQYVQIQFLEDDRQRNLATFRAAKTQTFTFAHDSTLAIYSVLLAGDRSGDTMPFYMYVPKAKETRYWSAISSFDPQPATAVNAVETVQVSLAVQSRTMTFYKDK
ncbi:phage tail protein [Serratia fonticola]|uniref:phage tail protein n=1 Tax=Serratia fonticola TaxID=47917 RepID=UPI0027F031BA|nr:phage tail protein [Serratia fonticola]MDQ7207715.1 phage tail protein [Serratia fonticola]HBE9077951.1 phage tail protein [Serratia fonticola]HBE9093218.1 phage tail protein [Serratia fonticola]HBE9150678.1 phage tail protein [Serratia fonticola]